VNGAVRALVTVPPTPKGRRTREKILLGARSVFALDGYVEARMTDIAQAAGLSTGGLYRHFISKEDVFVALIADLHEELYRSSGNQKGNFATEPLEALLEANRGYLSVYYENRDVMRAFREAAGVEKRFREIWWRMRNRHIDRFTHTMKSVHGITTIGGKDVWAVVDAMACMVEQCAYVWFSYEALNDRRVSVDSAAEIVTRIWYQAFFGD
jgi:AcrR family transcriptional regulator